MLRHFRNRNGGRRRGRSARVSADLRREAKAPDTRLPASLLEEIGESSGGGSFNAGTKSGGGRRARARNGNKKRTDMKKRSVKTPKMDTVETQMIPSNAIEPSGFESVKGRQKRTKKRGRSPEPVKSVAVDDDPDKKEIRRLEKLLGIRKKRKKAADSGQKFSYASALGEDCKEIAELVDLCSGGFADVGKDEEYGGLDDEFTVREDPADGLEKEDDDLEANFAENEGISMHVDQQGSFEIEAETEEDEEEGQKSKHIIEDDSGSSDASDSSDQDEDISSVRAERGAGTRSPATSCQSGGHKPEEKSTSTNTGKYVPPSRRKGFGDGTQRLGRRIRALLNRLAEANAAGIANNLEELFRSPGVNVSQITVVNLYASATLDAICDGSATAGLSPFVTPHAVIVCHLGSTIDVRVLAEVLVGVVRRISEALPGLAGKIEKEELLIGERPQRPIFGYVAFLGALYRRRAASAHVIHDLVRTLAEGTETHRAELLLALFRQIGPQLRADDPLSLKDMIAFLQERFHAERNHPENGAKIGVMLDLISAVKNNKLRKGDVLEHSARFPWAAKVDSPLSATFAELLDDSFTEARWWETETLLEGKKDGMSASTPTRGSTTNLPQDDNVGLDLGALAASLRLNTDFRRALFGAIMSSASVTDAYNRVERLGGLSAAKNRDRDTSRVILHCCAAERDYNPFYALLASRMCTSARAMRFTFEHALCDMFRVVASGGGVGGRTVSRRRVRNYSQFVADMLYEKALRLAVFKNVTDFDECEPLEKDLYSGALYALLRKLRVNAKGDQRKVIEGVSSIFKDLPRSERDLSIPLVQCLQTAVRDHAGAQTLPTIELAVAVLQKNSSNGSAVDFDNDTKAQFS